MINSCEPVSTFNKRQRYLCLLEVVDKICCREFSKHKIEVCEKTSGLRSGNASDLNSACLKVLVPVEIFQFSDMHYERRFLDTFLEHNIRPNSPV